VRAAGGLTCQREGREVDTESPQRYPPPDRLAIGQFIELGTHDFSFV
jgi:hypothetical protein